MTICTWLLFGREVFNLDLFLSYKFLRRFAPGDSLEEEFSIRIYSFPTNSFDDLHLATLGVFNLDLFLSYKFLRRFAPGDSLEEEVFN